MAGQTNMLGLGKYIDPNSFQGSIFDPSKRVFCSTEGAVRDLSRRLVDRYDPSLPAQVPTVLIDGTKGSCLTLASAMASCMRIVRDPRDVYVIIGSRKGLSSQEVHAWALIRSTADAEWLLYDPAARYPISCTWQSVLSRINTYVMFNDREILGSTRNMCEVVAGGRQ